MLPISFKFVAAGIAQQAKGALYRFSPSRTGDAPDWTNRGAEIQENNVKAPITDESFWEGRYVICTLTLEDPDTGEQLTINDAVATVTKEKKIVETAIVGRNGTVKEYISDGDYLINLTVGIQAVRDGVIADEYPSEELCKLRHFLDLDKTLNIYSFFLDLWDIAQVVVKKFSLTQHTYSNYQELTLELSSDNDYEILGTEY